MSECRTCSRVSPCGSQCTDEALLSHHHHHQVIDHHNAEALYAELLSMPPAVAAHVLPPVEKFLPDLSQRLAAYAQQHPEVLRANTFSATPARYSLAGLIAVVSASQSFQARKAADAIFPSL